MRNKILASMATLLLLAACETEGDKEVQNVDVKKGPIPGSSEDFAKNVKDRVFFALNKSAVTAADQATLKAQSDWFKLYPQTTATVEGHCDERGTREYNLGLGNRRADSVKKGLVKLGVGADRLKTISYGKEKPPVQGTGEAVWSQNRTAITVVN
jgi:peptidoglycan-associated lipoprotein